MDKNFKRDILFYKSYFEDFYKEQKPEEQKKITFVLGLIRDLKVVPEKFLKHLEGTDGLFEIRIKVGSNIYRIFCFFEKGHVVILLNGFNKKTQKTPAKEIEKAERLRKEYYNEKPKK